MLRVFHYVLLLLLALSLSESRHSWFNKPFDEIDELLEDGPGKQQYTPVTRRRKPNPVEVLCNPLLTEGDMLGTSLMTYGVSTKVQLWPNGVIPYEIHQDLWQEEDLIMASMRHIESQTCVKFKPREHENDYVGIIKGTGCYSYVGKLGRGGAQPLSIGEGCQFSGSIIHELIHAVGFHHEHSRMDRDHYVKILWRNLAPETVKQFAKVDTKKYPQYFHFDYDSVMLYGSTAFSKDGTSPTIIPTKSRRKRLKEVYHKTAMSPIDAKRIRKLYKCYGGYMKKK